MCMCIPFCIDSCWLFSLCHSKNKLILMISGPMLMIVLGMLLLKVFPATVKKVNESEAISETPKVQQETIPLVKYPEKKETPIDVAKVAMKKIEPSNPITKDAPLIPKAEVKVLKTLGKPDGETQTPTRFRAVASIVRSSACTESAEK